MTERQVTTYYADSSCNGVPQLISIFEAGCDNIQNCVASSVGTAIIHSKSECFYDHQANVNAEFMNHDASYVLMELYEDSNCDELFGALVFNGDGSCRALPVVVPNYGSVIAEVGADLAVNVQLFADESCSNSTIFSDTFALSSDEITECVRHTVPGFTVSVKIFSNYSSSSGNSSVSFVSSSSGSDLSPTAATPSPTTTTNTSSSSVGIGTIIGITAVAVVVVVVIVVFLISRKKRADRSINIPSPVSGGGGNKDSFAQELLGQHTEGTTASTDRTGGSKPSHNTAESLWNDEVIVAARIPREKVLMHERISRGGFGEVYVGVYNGRKVAIKMLLPEIRKRIQSVNEFLAKVKLMASLEHPRIVEFIGVAWDSLTDLCVVSELMEGGDLRALLSQFEAENHPLGFNHDKVKIALHVAHALTYMHSFSPPIVHRDLKSKNILLTNEFDAKLTDFGASRERVDRTMTAGVGTSLWMAPEIMAGEKYDEKADIFSFAIMLSELDSRTAVHKATKGDPCVGCSHLAARDAGQDPNRVLQRLSFVDSCTGNGLCGQRSSCSTKCSSDPVRTPASFKLVRVVVFAVGVRSLREGWTTTLH